MSNLLKFRSGPNRWRDSKKPSQILTDVCKLRGLNFVPPKPGETTLVVDKTVFSLDRYGKIDTINMHKFNVTNLLNGLFREVNEEKSTSRQKRRKVMFIRSKRIQSCSGTC